MPSALQRRNKERVAANLAIVAENKRTRKGIDKAALNFNEHRLTGKQEEFVQEYIRLKDADEKATPEGTIATNAYLTVHPEIADRNTARVLAERLLQKVSVRSRVLAYQSEFTAKHFISRDNVLAGFWKVYQRCIDAEPVVDFTGKPVVVKIPVKRAQKFQGVVLPDADENGDITLAAVWRFDSKGAIAALQSMGRYLGLFNADTTGGANVQVSVEVAAARDFITGEMMRLQQQPVTIDAEDASAE